MRAPYRESTAVLQVFRRERCVRRVRGDIMTKFPDPEQKEVMRVSGQRKIDKILERLELPSRIKFTCPRIPA